jgi:hypothetical protein
VGNVENSSLHELQAAYMPLLKIDLLTDLHERTHLIYAYASTHRRTHTNTATMRDGVCISRDKHAQTQNTVTQRRTHTHTHKHTHTHLLCDDVSLFMHFNGPVPVP